MKRVFMFSVLSVFVFTGAVFAHPPSEIDASYDMAAQELSVLIVHNTDDPETHFIKRISVIQNGENIIVRMFRGQEDGDTQSFSCPIPGVGSEDILTVEAHCSMGGSLSKDAVFIEAE